MTRPSPAAYTVLVPCTSGKTGKSYTPGDVVTAADFPAYIIKHWLTSNPPVLAVKDGD